MHDLSGVDTHAPYRTVWVAADGQSVEITDQTLLPHGFVVVTLRTLETVLRRTPSTPTAFAPDCWPTRWCAIGRKRAASVSAITWTAICSDAKSAEDVADAFVALALARKTTGAVLTVDGGNFAAAMR
jgi:hypothetical protein